MKKSTLAIIILEILLILSIVAHNVFDIGKPKNIEHYIAKELTEYQSSSLNYTLKYTMPEGYEEFENSREEIAIASPDNSALFVANPMPLGYITVEDFFKVQSSVFEDNSPDTPNITEANSDETTVDNKKITRKYFKVESSYLDLYALVATIEFEGKDEFIGIVANVPSLDYEEDFNTFVNSIEFTKQTTDKERIFANENEPIKLTVPANWLRLERSNNYSFYNTTEKGQVLTIIQSNDNTDLDPMADFQSIVGILSGEEGVSVIKDAEALVVDDKTITTSVMGFPGQEYYNVVSLVQFEGSNVYTLVICEVYSSSVDNFLKDIEKVTSSIELNKNYVSQDK